MVRVCERSSPTATRVQSFFTSPNNNPMDVSHSPDYKTELQVLVEHLHPKRLLCIGPEEPVLTPYADAAPDRELVGIEGANPLDALSGLGTFDFTYVSGTVEFMEKDRAMVLLSRLRDLSSRYLALLVSIGEGAGQISTWTSSDLLALGMVCRGSYHCQGRPLHLYTFDLATYKFTPDWFNPKHWAHPERWDKDWW